MKNFSTAIFYLLIVIFAGRLSPGQTVNNYLKLGNDTYKKFNNLVALSFYKKAYSLDTNSYKALLGMVKSYSSLFDEYEESEKENNELKGFAQEGINYSNKLVNLFPDSSQSYSYLAISYGHLADISSGKQRVMLAKMVESTAKEAIEKNPDSFLPYLVLGIYYEKISEINWIERTFANLFYGKAPKGNIDESLEMLNKAYELDSEVIATNYYLAIIYKVKNNNEKEIFYLKRIMELPRIDFKDKFYKEKAKARLNELTG
jgi:tetratricopeptide (TPR) repeat protein